MSFSYGLVWNEAIVLVCLNVLVIFVAWIFSLISKLFIDGNIDTQLCVCIYIYIWYHVNIGLLEFIWVTLSHYTCPSELNQASKI